jgi:hypothetical protein
MKKNFISPIALGFIVLFVAALLVVTAACASTPTPTIKSTTSPSLTASATATATPTSTVSPPSSPAPSVSPTAAPPSVTTTSLPDGITGTAYTQTLQAAGGTGNRVWAVSSGILPPGLALDAKSGNINGTPKAAADYFFTVSAIDSAGTSGSKALSININLAPILVSGIIVTTNSLPDGIIGSSYSQTLQAIGGSGGYKWSVASGSLPAGLTLDAGTGKISGTPRTAGAFTIFIEAADSSGTNAVQSMNMVVTNPSSTAAASPSPSPTAQANVLTITTSSMPAGIVGTQYSQTLKINNGTGPFGWSLQRGSLPSGLLLDAQLGLVFGVPAAAGTNYFLVQVTDAKGASSTQSLSITINSK